MLPNPIYTGGVPSRKKASSSGGGVYLGGSRKKKPHTSIKLSLCFGNRPILERFLTYM